MRKEGRIPQRDVKEVTIPLFEEEARIGKRRVETGSTKVSVKVDESEQVIEQPLMKEHVEVRHVAINRFIDAPAEVRTEGDVTIIPVMEEVLVVEKKLRLLEEVHIRQNKERNRTVRTPLQGGRLLGCTTGDDARASGDPRRHYHHRAVPDREGRGVQGGGHPARARSHNFAGPGHTG